MRKWSAKQGQRSQCLLCLFGVARQSLARSSSRRSLATSSSKQRLQASRAFRRDEDSDFRPKFKSSELDERAEFQFSSLKFQRGNDKGAAEVQSNVSETPEGRRRARLTKALEALFRQLSTPSEDGKTQLQDLDADGEQWKQFKASVLGLFELPTKELKWKQKEFRTELLGILFGPNQHENTTNYLYFAFLDQTLASKDLDVTRILNRVADLRYPTEWYPEARAKQRDIHLHIGPTNSGKTYNALKRLEAASTGFYAGPLRLLAHEVYSRFKSNGFPCDLITGDDVRQEIVAEDQVIRYASTVEMVDIDKDVEVAVIDEIQMIANEDRGWAWTRAFLGCRAQEVHLCGEARVLPLVQELCASMGDNLHVHRYERLNPLKVMSTSLRGNFKNLRKGDCVVTFTVMNIHAIKQQIERETGRRVAIVYGSLPPETRAQQAALFNDPDNDYDFLVASDAIGMGLNLSIKRVIFDSVSKFNGVTKQQLSIPQLKQIGGRAGRYRTSHDDMKGIGARAPMMKGADSASIGLVTTVDEKDLPVVRDALSREAPPIRSAGLLPPGDFVIAYASRLPAGVSHEYVMQRICDVAALHPRFNLCAIKDQVSIARVIQNVPGLTTADRCLITAAPADYKNFVGQEVVRALARAIGNKKQIAVVDVSEIPLEVLEKPLRPDRWYLADLEALHKALVLFLWLGYRFGTLLRDLDMAFHAKALTEERINAYLQTFSANKKLQRRLENVKQRNMQLAPGGEEHTQESSTVVDYSEGDVSEDLNEGDAAEVENGSETAAGSDTTALPIDWSRGAEDSTEMSNEDNIQPKRQAMSANG